VCYGENLSKSRQKTWKVTHQSAKKDKKTPTFGKSKKKSSTFARDFE